MKVLKNIPIVESDGMIYAGDDGEFYYSPDGKKLIKVPASHKAKVATRYNNWKLQQKDAEDPNFSQEDWEQEEAERKERARKKLAGEETIKSIKNDPDLKGSKYNIENRPKKKSRYAGAKHNSSFAELSTWMENSANNAVSMAIEYERELRRKWDYGEPDPFEEIDGEIRMPSYQYEPEDVEVEKPEDRPFVLFYFDCSGSCQTDNFIKLGKNLVAQMKQLEKEEKIYCKDLYFDTSVYERFFSGGGTSGEAVLRDIKARTNNGEKIANIILFTDNGCDGVSMSVEVQGYVAFIFKDVPGRDIIDHLKGTAGNQVFYYDDDSKVQAG